MQMGDGRQPGAEPPFTGQPPMPGQPSYGWQGPVYPQFPQPYPQSPPPPANSGRGARVLAGVLAVLLIVALAGAGFLGAQWRHAESAASAAAVVDTAGEEELRQAADAFAVLLTSIDFEHADESLGQILDGSTGEFKDQYADTHEKLSDLLRDNKATADGKVVESAVQSFDGDVGVVLLFVDQTVSNANVPEPRLDRSRMKLTMRKVDGRWLAEKVELA